MEADRWWLCLADSDAGLWARGVALNSGMDVTVRQPDAYALQVQGPRSKDVMVSLFGESVMDIRYYWCRQDELDGIPVRVCGLSDLIAMKRAAGRPRDLDDLRRLGAG